MPEKRPLTLPSEREARFPPRLAVQLHPSQLPRKKLFCAGLRKVFGLFLAGFQRNLEVKWRKKTQKAEKQQIRFLKVEKVGFWAKSKNFGHFGRAGPISPTFESGLDLAGRFRVLLEAENVFG